MEEYQHTMSNWAELQRDLLIEIAKRVAFLEDFSVFSRVCRSWRLVAVEENFKGSQQIPWLMLAEEDNGSSSRRLVSATDGNPIGNLLLPEAEGRRCMETLGWLVTASEAGDINLLDPISRVQIPLPHISTFKHYEDNMPVNFFYIQKAVLSSRPCISSKENNYVLMVTYEGCGFLGFWKSGDKAWTTIETHEGAFHDITYHHGQFYAVNSEGNVFVCDVGGRDPTVAQLCGGIPTEILFFKRPYIVESTGEEVLIVVRDGYELEFDEDAVEEEDSEFYSKDENEFKGHYGTKEFRVFKVDLSNREWVELQSLGDNALFVGDNASISVQASKFQGIRPNCIYFTDDCWPGYIWSKRGGGKDMGIYNMEDRSLTPCYKGSSFSRFCPPLWVRPYF
ncbi:hypothetical protein Vadar_019799 [Vaccinium darrowii]|uniref:Uncharacterized protein n=1 Tax=Vaccinium darrowii TaxID=229202 RepID=A0ACB7XIQ1_9ERIC|nr:hypothetical protein Vadar_019799 [Vaccinium darrowii]